MKKYNRYTYMKKLERSLRKLSAEEYNSAISYYNEYFDEAGPASEEEVCERLGPPKRLATEIRADVALMELNQKEARAQSIKEARREMKQRRKDNKKATYSFNGENANVESNGTTPGEQSPFSSGNEGNWNSINEQGTATSYDKADNPKIREGILASWLGVFGMLAMPGAKVLTIFAFVLGIIGLVASVIVVVGIFIIAGGLAVSGVVSIITGVLVLTQDASATTFLAGSGIFYIGLGIVIGVLNYLLGRVIFKGIANLSGKIRNKKRIKILKEGGIQ